MFTLGGKTELGGLIATEECQCLLEPLPPPSESVGGEHLSCPHILVNARERGDGQTNDFTEKVESLKEGGEH